MNAKGASQFSDEQLAAACDAALEKLTPRARAHALAVAGGKTAAQAARELGLSTNGRVLAKMKSRTAAALALLREQTRRKSHLTAEAAARWLEDVADEARSAKDYSAATRAKSEAAKILGLYPETRLKLLLEQPSVDLTDVTAEEMEALALLRHGVRRQLAASSAVVETTMVDVPVGEEVDRVFT
jgi:hypothetical protein